MRRLFNHCIECFNRLPGRVTVKSIWDAHNEILMERVNMHSSSVFIMSSEGPEVLQRYSTWDSWWAAQVGAICVHPSWIPDVCNALWSPSQAKWKIKNSHKKKVFFLLKRHPCLSRCCCHPCHPLLLFNQFDAALCGLLSPIICNLDLWIPLSSTDDGVQWFSHWTTFRRWVFNTDHCT